MSTEIPIKDFARMMCKKHAETLFMVLVDSDKTFNELSALSTPTATHEIMKRAENLEIVEVYYNGKTGHKTFRLLMKEFEFDLT